MKEIRMRMKVNDSLEAGVLVSVPFRSTNVGILPMA